MTALDDLQEVAVTYRSAVRRALIDAVGYLVVGFFVLFASLATTASLTGRMPALWIF